MSIDVRNRLQPALLDRLTDDHPDQRKEVESHRVMSKAQLRQAVLRDLGALFNSVQPLAASAEPYPMLAESVLEAAIRQAIVRFEPRILPDTLQVKAQESAHVLDTHNVIEFEIRGHLWSQPK